MKWLQSLGAGLVGAVTVNILHEGYRRFDSEAPRLDLVGEEALAKTVEATGHEAPGGSRLYKAALAGDIISNTGYYSLIGKAKTKHLLLAGAGLGIAAGLSALKLTRPLGLDDSSVNQSTKTKLLTVGYYVVGGLITAWVIKKLRSNEEAM